MLSDIYINNENKMLLDIYINNENNMLSVINSKVPMKLHDWIPFDELNWEYMSSNPNAIHILEEN